MQGVADHHVLEDGVFSEEVTVEKDAAVADVPDDPAVSGDGEEGEVQGAGV